MKKRKGKFCFLCGKKTEKLIEGHCEDCFNEKNWLAKLPEKTEVIRCSRCDLTKISNEWKEFDLINYIRKIIKINGTIKKMSLDSSNKKTLVTVEGFVKGSKKLKRETHSIIIHFNKIVCPVCVRKYGGYYEAIIQLRGNYKKSLNFIKRFFINESGKNEMAFYSIKEVKGGLDLYVGDKKSANKLSKLLKEKYSTEKKVSYTLATRKDGNDLYRNIILIRF